MNNRHDVTPLMSQQQLISVQAEISTAYRNFEQMLLRRAFFKTNSIEVSQDLVQVTFLKTIQYLQRGGKINLMQSFLNNVLNGLIIDSYRKRKSQSLDFLLEKGFEPASDEHQRHIDIIDGGGILLLLTELPKKYELVLGLRYVKEFSISEIALLTGLSENTIAVQAHRGLTKLRVLYEERSLCNKNESVAA